MAWPCPATACCASTRCCRGSSAPNIPISVTPDVATELRLRRRVQFSETDAAGIVHFSCFFRYMEDAEHALWRANDLRIHTAESAIGWPRVAASCEFHRALKFE